MTRAEVLEVVARLSTSDEEASNRWLWGRFLKEWHGLAEAEKTDLCEAVASQQQASIEQWFESESAPEELLSGGRGWLCASVRSGWAWKVTTSDSVKQAERQGEVALHGLRIPGGFVEWRPTEGKSQPKAIFSHFGGVRIDLRGRDVPSPAASRLFLPSSAIHPSLFPFARGILRYSLEISGGRPVEEGWDGWLENLLSGLRPWTREILTLREEMAELRSRALCEIWFDRQRQRIRLVDLPRYFAGPHVPVPENGSQNGLVSFSTFNSFVTGQDLEKVLSLELNHLLSLAR